MPYHVYISNAGSEYLSHFLMDETTGKLEPRDDIQLEGSPGAVATNADQSRMYIALRSQQRLASYEVDRSSGGLKMTGATALDEGPPYIYTDDTDGYLLASYYGGGYITVHRIEADGTLSDAPLQQLETGIRAHSIQTDRSNRFAFVPHTNPTNAIYQFKFDASSGALTPNDPPFIQPETPEGPRHFVFHPQLDVLYSVNENGSTVSAHRFDPERGTLASFQVISTLPDGFDGSDNTCAEIQVAPDGKHLYASNRGHDSLALFAVGQDGALEARDHFPTEATPRFFELDPTGAYVYSVGQGSGRLASYQIDAASGALTPLETHPVGESPLWVQFVAQA